MLPPDNRSRDVFGHYQRVIDAVEVGVRANQLPRVVLQSSYGSHHASGTGPIVGTYLAEQTLSAVVDHLYILRNGYFMENFKWLAQPMQSAGMAQPMQSAGMIPLPVSGASKTAFVATQDIAVVAAETLTDETWSGHHLREVLGPEDLSFNEVAAMIADASGRSIKHYEMSDEEAMGALTQPEVGFSPQYAALFIDLHRAIDRGHLTSEFPRSQQSTTSTDFRKFAEAQIVPLLQETS